MPNTHFNPVHLEKLKQSLKEGLASFESTTMQTWWNHVAREIGYSGVALTFPKKPVGRKELKQICADKSKSDLYCTVAILAWGIPEGKHGQDAIESFENFQPIIAALRAGEMSHIEAYQHFSQLRASGQCVGLAPGFFTKLIFFCHPDHKGYMMDQWAARSINLLSDSKLIYFTGPWVNDKNDAEIYEEFCALTDELAKVLKLRSGEEAEMAMVSKGNVGRKNTEGAWRKYIRAKT